MRASARARAPPPKRTKRSARARRARRGGGGGGGGGETHVTKGSEYSCSVVWSQKSVVMYGTSDAPKLRPNMTIDMPSSVAVVSRLMRS